MSMADLSDEQLRSALKELSGKDVGPVTPSTRKLYEKRYLKLSNPSSTTTNTARSAQNSKKLKADGEELTPKSKSFSGKPSRKSDTSRPRLGFSSDSDDEYMNQSTSATTTTTNTSTNNARTGQRSTSSTLSKPKTSRGSSRKNTESESEAVYREVANLVRPNSDSSVTRRSSSKRLSGSTTPSSKSRIEIKNSCQLCSYLDEDDGSIVQMLYDLTGQRYPVTAATKQQLCIKLLNADSTSHTNYRLCEPHKKIYRGRETIYSDEEENDSGAAGDNSPAAYSGSVSLGSRLLPSHTGSAQNTPESKVNYTPYRRRPLSSISKQISPTQSSDEERPTYLNRYKYTPVRRSEGVQVNLESPELKTESEENSDDSDDSIQIITPLATVKPQYTKSTRATSQSKKTVIPHKIRSSTWRPVPLGITVLILCIVSAAILKLYHSDTPLAQMVQPGDYVSEMLCNSKIESPSDTCFSEEQLKEALLLVQPLKDYLSTHAGLHECNYDGYSERGVSLSNALSAMTSQYGKEVKYRFNVVLWLILKNPQWEIRVTSFDGSVAAFPVDVHQLESVYASRPMSCVIRQGLSRMFVLFVSFLTVCLLGYGGYKLGMYRKTQLQRTQDLIHDIVEEIKDRLEEQHKRSLYDPMEQPYIPICQMKKLLINDSKMNSNWEKAVTYIRNNEPSIREELQQIHGEEFAVWRLIRMSSPRPPGFKNTWQGSALAESPSRKKLDFKPTECMKIRGMFDINKETGNTWPMLYEDAVLKKLGSKHGVVHIAVDTASEESRIYVKFATNKHAGRAFPLLNGHYFGGRCVECKFLPTKKYLQRFPHLEHQPQQ